MTRRAIDGLLARYRDVRAQTVALAAPLSVDDQLAQSMPDASPTKWHLGHTTWFFETMVLEAFVPGYRPHRADAAFTFNSYYESLGDRRPRAERSLSTRPTLDEVHAYRRAVDEAVAGLSAAEGERAFERLELGIQHEQQHQELVLTDVKSVLAPQGVAYVMRAAEPDVAAPPLRFEPFDGGLIEIGDRSAGFAFDNERPRHRVWLDPFAIGSRLVTAGEWLAFMEADGYGNPALWLSDGWATKKARGWRAPRYWRESSGGWTEATMLGERPVSRSAPVCHVSYYEADAFAQWSGARLPSEAEWEHALGPTATAGNLLESGAFHTRPAGDHAGVVQAAGDAWEWTASAYAPYPRFVPFDGALAEYNGKFMCNQFVLRGGSCFTPGSHLRPTYRNFFPADARWQMSGVRLARWR
ncbi:MAG TPA: ergothioneine biosynthesis protein EgtB [Polyangiaceae bacterium]